MDDFDGSTRNDGDGSTAARKATKFLIHVSRDNGTTWTVLIGRHANGRTQDEAKKDAIRILEADDTFGPVIANGQLGLALSSARSWKPILVGVEPQPSKITTRPLT